MSRQKLRVHNTQLDNLISNLRGEVGEIITTWVLLRHMMVQQRQLSSDDFGKDLANESLAFVSLLKEKLADEIVARLSELAEEKIGRLTFHFAALKLSKLDGETRAFSAFISRQRFQQKRNSDISHKELPEQWSDHKHLTIPYRTILRGVAGALRLMRTIDRIVLGPAAPYLWREMRKKRYQFVNPAKVGYMLLPHLNLSPEIRERVVIEEMAEGRPVWSDMMATIGGRETRVSACREWGAFLLDGRLIVLSHYPLVDLTIQVSPADETPTAVAPEYPIDVEPITGERQITTKYRLTKRSDVQLSFAPVQRVHQLDNGGLTELPDLDINLNDKIQQDFGAMALGDEKEFSLTVTVLIGYRQRGAEEIRSTE